jgi:hypothetical protein
VRHVEKELNSDRFGHPKPVAPQLRRLDRSTCYSLGDADTTHPGGGVKSKKNLFEKSVKDAEKNRVSTGWRAKFINRSRASLLTPGCAKPVDFISCRSRWNSPFGRRFTAVPQIPGRPSG